MPAAFPPYSPLSEWHVDSGCEPGVRIGIVLAGDRIASLAAEATVAGTVESDGGDRFRVLPAMPLRFHLDDACARVDGSGRTLHARRIRIFSDVRSDRAPTLRLHGIPAGRGFHWEKRISAAHAGCIEILPSAGGLVVVNELPLEPYLAGVITAEMGERCPAALLSAQCIVARSWLLARTEPKHADDPFDRCNDDCCQRYQGCDAVTAAAERAALDTWGQVLLAPNGRVLDANYSKSCGGVSELPEFVWGAEKPGITAVCDAPPDCAARALLPVNESNLDAFLGGAAEGLDECYCSPARVPRDRFAEFLGRVDEPADYFRWTIRIDHDQLVDAVRNALPEAAELACITALRPLRRGVSGRIVRLAVDGETTDGAPLCLDLRSEYEIRRVLHRRFLFSSAFLIDETRAGDRLGAVTLRGAGWGHGVGFCQIGALGMALCGCDAHAICRHYFPTAVLKTVYGMRAE